MLRNAMYLNTILYAVMALYVCIHSFRSGNTRNWMILSLLLVALTGANWVLLDSIVETGWKVILLVPIALVTVILLLISFIRNCIMRKNLVDKPSMVMTIGVLAVPILLFVATYIYELNQLKHCDYLVHFNYQNGIVQSDHTYIAIRDHKAVPVTLTKMPGKRQSSFVYGRSRELISCEIMYQADGTGNFQFHNVPEKYEHVFQKLEQAVRNEYADIDYVEAYYLPETGDVLVRTFEGGYVFYNEQKTSTYVATGQIKDIQCYVHIDYE